MPAVCFSLVLYNHSFDSVKPLLLSISSLLNNAKGLRILLSAYDGSPRHFNSPTIAELKNFAPLLDISLEKGPNIGFGRANNRNFLNSCLDDRDLFVVVNPDIHFSSHQLWPLLNWVLLHDNFSCVAPLVMLLDGKVQHSAKHDPTVLSLLLGRFNFLLSWSFSRQYDSWHKNLDKDYFSDMIKCTYLSGCFLIIPSWAYSLVGGFTKEYFLHVEDADIVRKLSAVGKTAHNPIGVVFHGWARGSHFSARQGVWLFKSYFIYCLNWGFRLF